MYVLALVHVLEYVQTHVQVHVLLHLLCSTHTSLSLTGASALLAWSILGMGDLGSSLGSGRRMRSLEGLMEEEEKEEDSMKCKNGDEIGHGNETIEEGRENVNYEF